MLRQRAVGKHGRRLGRGVGRQGGTGDAGYQGDERQEEWVGGLRTAAVTTHSDDGVGSIFGSSFKNLSVSSQVGEVPTETEPRLDTPRT